MICIVNILLGVSSCSKEGQGNARHKIESKNAKLKPVTLGKKGSVMPKKFGGSRQTVVNRVLRDPFNSYFDLIARDTIKVNPLERFNVQSFRLVGVVDTPSGSAALVEDPLGNGYTLYEGMALGRNKSVIKRIGSKSIVVLMKVKDSSGNLRKKLLSLEFSS